jgi:hypothetical protein
MRVLRSHRRLPYGGTDKSSRAVLQEYSRGKSGSWILGSSWILWILWILIDPSGSCGSCGSWWIIIDPRGSCGSWWMLINMIETMLTINLCRWSRSNVVLECIQLKNYPFQQFLLLFFLMIVFFKRQRTEDVLLGFWPNWKQRLFRVKLSAIVGPRVSNYSYKFQLYQSKFCRTSIFNKIGSYIGYAKVICTFVFHYLIQNWSHFYSINSNH